MKHVPTFFASLLMASAVMAGTPSPPALAEAPARRWDLSLTLDTGWRHDELEWTIAGDPDGPDILSDLHWKDLEIIPVSLAAEVKLPDRWRAVLSGGYGWLVDGWSRDSDYDNHEDFTAETDRSESETRGHTVDAEFAIGYDLPAWHGVTLTPWLGLSYRQLHFKDGDGLQVLDSDDDDVPSPIFDSAYKAEWFGAVFGLDISARLSDTARFVAGGRYERVAYEGAGNWSGGFRDHAHGDGWRLDAGLEWDIAPRWTFDIRAEWDWFGTDSGTQHNLNGDGDSKFNEAEWRSVGVLAGLTYRF